MRCGGSIYNPPRAGWLGRGWNRLAGAVRRGCHRRRGQADAWLSFWEAIKIVFVPCHGWEALGSPLLRWMAVTVYGLAALICLVWLGHSASTLAFGFMISVHVTGVSFAMGRLDPEQRMLKRILFSFLSTVALVLLIYMPLHRLVTGHLFMPLRMDGRVLVVSRLISASELKVGDQVAYRIEAGSGSAGYVIAAGFGVGEIQATGGESIRFTSRACVVAQRVYPRQADMPVNETWVVPEDHWFVWPELSMNVAGRGADARLAAALHDLAMVAEDEMLGRVCRRWFWRRQELR